MMREDPRLKRLSAICMKLPEAERKPSGDHAAFRVRGKVFAYFLNDHHGDGIVAVCCKSALGENVDRVSREPQRFYLPAYIGPRGWFGMRLDSATIRWDEVRAIVESSYRLVATRKLASLLDGENRSIAVLERPAGGACAPSARRGRPAYVGQGMAPASRKAANRVSVRGGRTVTFDDVRAAAHTLPGVEDSISYGTPALKVRGKLFARLHQDGDCFVLRANVLDRQILMQIDPVAFFITDHYRAYPWVLVRFAAIQRRALPELLERAWRMVAPKTFVAKHARDDADASSE
jgi:phosphoribosylglycinamide formyltransferase-1